eukprot:jgi/Picre1/27716/NNA_000680.t1
MHIQNGSKEEDAEAAFFADFENDEVATAAGDGEQEEPVVAVKKKDKKKDKKKNNKKKALFDDDGTMWLTHWLRLWRRRKRMLELVALSLPC